MEFCNRNHEEILGQCDSVSKGVKILKINFVFEECCGVWSGDWGLGGCNQEGRLDIE